MNWSKLVNSVQISTNVRTVVKFKYVVGYFEYEYNLNNNTVKSVKTVKSVETVIITVKTVKC